MHTVSYTYGNLQGSGAQSDADIVAAPGAGKHLYIKRIVATVGGGAANFQITEGADAAGTRLIDMYAGENGGIQEEYDPPLKLAANTALKCTSSANNIKVSVLYWSS